jgi:hypothetical protein
MKNTAAAGRGNPKGTKVVNPQHTLEAKKALVRKAGGKMVWKGRQWVVVTPKADPVEIPSRKLAGYSLKTFGKVLHLSA